MRFLALGIVLFGACNNSNTDCEPNATIPSDCVDIEPATGELSIELTIDSENQLVPISVYYGYADDSTLYFRDTISTKRVSYTVPISQRYSVVAKYSRNSLRIDAVDGGKVKLKTNENCGYTCYTVDDLDLDLTLIR